MRHGGARHEEAEVQLHGGDAVLVRYKKMSTLISRGPEIRGGRPCIAGTGISVRRIAQWHNMGLIPEEIARKFGHLSLAHVQAALAYYLANHAEIDADLESEARETEALEEQHRRAGKPNRLQPPRVANTELRRAKTEFLREFGGLWGDSRSQTTAIPFHSPVDQFPGGS